MTGAQKMTKLEGRMTKETPMSKDDTCRSRLHPVSSFVVHLSFGIHY